jgi:hypothetical protein
MRTVSSLSTEPARRCHARVAHARTRSVCSSSRAGSWARHQERSFTIGASASFQVYQRSALAASVSGLITQGALVIVPFRSVSRKAEELTLLTSAKLEIGKAESRLAGLDGLSTRIASALFLEGDTRRNSNALRV